MIKSVPIDVQSGDRYSMAPIHIAPNHGVPKPWGRRGRGPEREEGGVKKEMDRERVWLIHLEAQINLKLVNDCLPRLMIVAEEG